jgi:NAD(P)-dependent dehydrogenase (short-subunit alcohol dehydrogenase family)
MKSAALELGKHEITVSALVPGLIDMALARHEEQYTQALEVADEKPAGDKEWDEAAAAQEGRRAQSPLAFPGSTGMK